MSCSLARFHLIRPLHELSQEKILDWIARAHAQAEAFKTGTYSEAFYTELKERLFRLGVGPDKIQRRGTQIEDLLKQEWSAMAIYPLQEVAEGAGFRKRSQFFDQVVTEIFEQFYPTGAELPAHLIHTTCTGYVAPSPAQKIVSKRQAYQHTNVTHAYHMGCYAAIPSIRMGLGFLHLPSPLSNPCVDIVHTEMCSLHIHPLKHSTEQLVIESLFADGFIKYSVCKTAEVDHCPHLKILTLREEIIPESTRSMTWSCEDHGMGMTVAKDVPAQITHHLQAYLQRLHGQTGLQSPGPAYFAIHPGGPKILSQIQQCLHLQDWQIQHTCAVLRDYGNMSSATLPHIWERILKDPEVEEGAWITSLAFGPGLSISGGIFQKQMGR